MRGTGVPMVTPFDEDGALDENGLRSLATWLTDRGVDFLVPCGSTSEAPLLSPAERTRVIEVVADAADVPVVAGTGYPGYDQTVRATRDAAAAGADAALVVTPFYYEHGRDAMVAYYRELADAVELPVYLYSVPKFTGRTLAPETVGTLAEHANVAGLKDSSGNLAGLQRTRRLAPDIDLLVGAGGIYGHGLAAGADGGILALANIAPEPATEVYERATAGDLRGALELTADLVALNRAITGRFGIPGLKAAMRLRGAPAGVPRRPFSPAGDDAVGELSVLLDELDLL